VKSFGAAQSRRAAARRAAAHRGLAEQFSGRQVSKTYLALVEGEVKTESGRIARPIARDPVHRTRMTARLAEGRAACSDYRVLRRFPGFTLLEVRIGTGRTHQIRIHLSESGHPLVGEEVYIRDYTQTLIKSTRLLLHAATLGFEHPITGERVELASELPPDFTAMLDRLQ